MAAETTSIGSASITPAETWDAVQASTVAGIVGPIACVVYVLFLAWLGVSYVRFIYFIQPTLKWAKNTELEKMSKLLSDYQRITGLFSQYAGLFSMNVLSVAMAFAGTFQTIGGTVNSQGAALCFIGLLGNAIFGMALFFPNHELEVPRPDIAQSVQFIKKHAPVERDTFYVVTDEILEEWTDRPEAWSFETAPWGPTIVTVREAIGLMAPNNLLPMPFVMPLVDADVETYVAEQTKLELIATGKLQKEDIGLSTKELEKASEANLSAIQLQELAYKRRIKEDQLKEAEEAKALAGDEDDDDDEEVGPEIEVDEDTQLERRRYACIVDPRSLLYLKMEPVRGVCTVFGTYPVPTWQEISYFEVYIAKATAFTNIVVGLATRPFPHWRFPGHANFSVGLHSKGDLLLSTCDFEREGRSQPFGCHAALPTTPGLANAGPWQRKLQILQDMHFSSIVAKGLNDTDEETIQFRRFCDTAQRWDCVGCMYNRATGRVRFTVNGKQLQPACHIPNKLWYPAIGVDDAVEFQVNFGTQPFRCVEYDHLEHGFGRSLRNPDGGEELGAQAFRHHDEEDVFGEQ